jgi:hypothetical protein
MRFLVLVLLTLGLSVAASASCQKVRISGRDAGVTHELCHDPKSHSYLSEACKSVEACFELAQVQLQYYPNQSPGFSLCYQVGGTPFFSKAEGKSLDFCEKNQRVSDIDGLLRAYKRVHQLK